MLSWKQGEENNLCPRQTELAFISVTLQGLIVEELVLVAVTWMTAPLPPAGDMQDCLPENREWLFGAEKAV